MYLTDLARTAASGRRTRRPPLATARLACRGARLACVRALVAGSALCYSDTVGKVAPRTFIAAELGGVGGVGGGGGGGGNILAPW